NKPVWLIVGLGNPGASYARTKHNVGSELVERIASRIGAELKRGRAQMRIGEGTLEGVPVALGVPTTYMNESGRPIARALKKEGLRPDQLVIVQDELDLAPGVVRLKVGGGTAGHNGLRSIEASLRSRDFLRIRIGVGKPPSKDEGVDHVLSKFTPDERKLIEDANDRAWRAIEILVRDGVDAAQNHLHAPR
ncbi:MAG: aminoacyl-tRNA hydrolase, partial [Actinomycetota bacterium]